MFAILQMPKVAGWAGGKNLGLLCCKSWVRTPSGLPKNFKMYFYQQMLRGLLIACLIKLEGDLYSSFFYFLQLVMSPMFLYFMYMDYDVEFYK